MRTLSRFLRAALAAGLAVVVTGAARAQEQAGAGPARKHVTHKWAVLIGVDDYLELRKLKYAGDDQRALAAQLVAVGFPKDQVYLLHDKAEQNRYRPFRENIEKQLALVLGMAEKDDLVIVGFSGHGLELEGKSYICPADAKKGNLAETIISLDSIYAQLGKSQAALKLLLVDACHNDLLPLGPRPGGELLPPSLRNFAAEQRPPEGIVLLASCGSRQISMEDDRLGHGVFMHFLLEGLKGEAAEKEGSITLAGLYNFASLQTKKYVALKFNDFQTPAWKGEINGPWEICKPGQATTVTNSLGIKLVRIPAGEFMMGASPEEIEAMNAWMHQQDPSTDMKYVRAITNHDGPQHRVRITKPFYLGACHVTRGQFRQFVADVSYKTDAEKGAGFFKGGYGCDPDKGFAFDHGEKYSWRNAGFEQTDEHPVVNVSWNDATEFCKWLSRKEGKDYRLPTEAEWEYACRAGTTTRYWCGDDQEKLAEVANVRDAAVKAKFPDAAHTLSASDGYVFTSPVGSFRPNPFGLYDMHGNAFQWCADSNRAYNDAAPPADDPKGPDSGKHRVFRGSSWLAPPEAARSACRNAETPDFRTCHLGFRVTMTP